MTIEPCTGTLAPEYAERVRLIEGFNPHGPGDRTPEQQARLAEYDAPYGPLRLPPCDVRDAVVDGPHGPIPVRVYSRLRQAQPSSPEPVEGPIPEPVDGPIPEPVDGPIPEPVEGPALVWLHGGAFLGGDLDMPEADHSARYIAGTTGRPVVSVAYRLAGDGVHHPIPEDDVVAAYTWTRDGGTGLAVDPDRVAIGGGSAGACLSASAALRLRDAGTPPWRLFMIYPVAHWDVPEPSEELAAALAQLPGSGIPSGMRDFINTNYVGGQRESAGPYAFPGDGHDLAGLPPTYVENCEFDDLRSSGELFVRQLADAGVPVECVTAAGVPHAHLNWQGSERAYATLQRISDRLSTASD